MMRACDIARDCCTIRSNNLMSASGNWSFGSSVRTGGRVS
jgi:hypothetical protein